MEIIGRRNVYTGKYTKTDIANIKLSNGKIVPWEVISRINNMPVVSALVENISHNTFVLVEQYRAPVDKIVVELVAGICDKPISNEQIIREEILEETGYTALQIELLLKDSPQSPGIISELSNTYYAKVSGERGEQRLQDSEQIKVLEFEKSDLYRFLDSKRKEGLLVANGIYSVIGNMMSKGVNILD